MWHQQSFKFITNYTARHESNELGCDIQHYVCRLYGGDWLALNDINSTLGCSCSTIKMLLVGALADNRTMHVAGSKVHLQPAPVHPQHRPPSVRAKCPRNIIHKHKAAAGRRAEQQKTPRTTSCSCNEEPFHQQEYYRGAARHRHALTHSIFLSFRRCTSFTAENTNRL